MRNRSDEFDGVESWFATGLGCARQRKAAKERSQRVQVEQSTASQAAPWGRARGSRLAALGSGLAAQGSRLAARGTGLGAQGSGLGALLTCRGREGLTVFSLQLSAPAQAVVQQVF